EPEGKVQDLALQLRAVAGADELEGPRVAVRGALDHAVDDGSGEALKPRAVAPGHAREDGDRVVLDLHVDVRRERTRELPLRALDVDLAVRDRDGDALRDVDRAL